MNTSTSADERMLRAILFRRDAKSGIREIMMYVRARESIKDPMLWPARPTLSMIGVKNGLDRLRSDLVTLSRMLHRKTHHLVAIV